MCPCCAKSAMRPEAVVGRRTAASFKSLIGTPIVLVIFFGPVCWDTKCKYLFDSEYCAYCRRW